MTRPTDEEIEKAARQASFGAQNDIDAFGAEMFARGARWALSRAQALEWKRPEEEMPRPNEKVLTYRQRYEIEWRYCDLDHKWRYCDPNFRWADDVTTSEFPVLAWARIELPEWVK